VSSNTFKKREERKYSQTHTI